MSAHGLARGAAAAILATMLTACGGLQSALAPAGLEAGRIAILFWFVTVLSTVIFVGVFALTTIALIGRPDWRRRISDNRIIIGGGIVFPIVVLTGLLIYALALLQAGSGRAAGGGLRITVVGEQWWWRVIYDLPDGGQVVSANELRIPVGRPVEIALETADVIHSFWVPTIAGKLDMIPGRTNVLTVTATEAGVSRGQCAEYCGGAHALMAFYVVALPEEEFQAWLEHEAGPAQEPQTPVQARGLELFLDTGCGGCHAVRGTPADGVIGPDLTHVGSRMSLGAATLPNDAEAFARWIADNQHIKPENLMPPFQQFEPEELQALSLYLEGLK
jgi:cytochrome c oxidase subunit 2